MTESAVKSIPEGRIPGRRRDCCSGVVSVQEFVVVEWAFNAAALDVDGG